MTSTDQQLDLDAIEAAANAATPGPWGTYQYGGDSLIEIAADIEDTGCGYSARRTIARFDEEPLDNDPAHREWTAEEDWAQVQADAAYIAAMSPEVAKAFVDEVRRLRAREAELDQKLAHSESIRENADFHLGQEMARRQLAEKRADNAVAALQEKAQELSAEAEQEMRRDLEEQAQVWHEAADMVRRVARKEARSLAGEDAAAPAARSAAVVEGGAR